MYSVHISLEFLADDSRLFPCSEIVVCHIDTLADPYIDMVYMAMSKPYTPYQKQLKEAEKHVHT